MVCYSQMLMLIDFDLGFVRKLTFFLNIIDFFFKGLCFQVTELDDKFGPAVTFWRKMRSYLKQCVLQYTSTLQYKFFISGDIK